MNTITPATSPANNKRTLPGTVATSPANKKKTCQGAFATAINNNLIAPLRKKREQRILSEQKEMKAPSSHDVLRQVTFAAVHFNPEPVMAFVNKQKLAPKEKEGYFINLIAFITAESTKSNAPALSEEQIKKYADDFDQSLTQKATTELNAFKTHLIATIEDKYKKLIADVNSEQNSDNAEEKQKKITELETKKNSELSNLDGLDKAINNFFSQSTEYKKTEGLKAFEKIAEALGGMPYAAHPQGAEELQEHIKSSLQNTETPLNLGESSTQGELVDDLTPNLQFASSLGASLQSLDTQRQSVVLILIYNTIPGLDIIAAVWYLQKYGIYNNSLSLVDNLIINSHLLPKLVLLDSYINQITESRRALLEIKEKMAETHKDLHSKDDNSKPNRIITRILDPTEYSEVADETQLAERHKFSKVFYEKLQDSLATLQFDLSGADNKERIKTLLSTKEFDTLFNDKSINWGDSIPKRSAYKTEVIEKLATIIQDTRQCTHLTEADENSGGSNTPTNSFRVLNNKINNAKTNLISLAREVPFRDYGVVSFKEIEGQKEYKRTFLEVLEGLYENPGDHKIWGPTGQTDVFGKKVHHQQEGSSRHEWGPRDLMQHPDVLRGLIKPLLELFGSKLVTAEHESESQANAGNSANATNSPDRTDVEIANAPAAAHPSALESTRVQLSAEMGSQTGIQVS